MPPRKKLPQLSADSRGHFGCGLNWHARVGKFRSVHVPSCQHLIEAVRIKADHHFFADDNRRGRAALVFADELANRSLIAGDVFYFELNPSLREVGFRSRARRSSRLAEHNDFLLTHTFNSSHQRLKSSSSDYQKRKMDAQSSAKLNHAPSYRRLSVCGSVWISTLKS